MTKRDYTLLAGILILIILMWGMSSCGPAAKLRRAQKLIAKAELQGATWRVDTVWRTTEVIVPEVRTDTIFHSRVGDTVVITKDRLQVRYVRLPGDSVFIEGECESDTVEILTPVIVTREISAKKRSWTFYVAWALLLMILAFVTGYLLRSRSGKDLNIRFRPPEE